MKRAIEQARRMVYPVEGALDFDMLISAKAILEAVDELKRVNETMANVRSELSSGRPDTHWCIEQCCIAIASIDKFLEGEG